MAILTYAQFIAVYPSTGASQALIEALIAVAQAELERYCGRLFESASRTEYFTPNGLPSLVLSNTPITAVASIVATDASGTEATVDSDTYRWDANTGIVEFISSHNTRAESVASGDRQFRTFAWTNNWGRQFKSVTATYTGGYATIPADIQQLTRDMVDAMIANGAGGAGTNFSVTSETLGSYSYTRGNANNPNQWWQTRAAMYRRLYV